MNAKPNPEDCPTGPKGSKKHEALVSLAKAFGSKKTDMLFQASILICAACLKTDAPDCKSQQAKHQCMNNSRHYGAHRPQGNTLRQLIGMAVPG